MELHLAAIRCSKHQASRESGLDFGSVPEAELGEHLLGTWALVSGDRQVEVLVGARLITNQTLVETSLAAYGRFVRPLASDEEERHYREMAIVGRLFGTPASVIPASLADFQEYMRAQLSGPDLCVTNPAREVAAVILEARLPRPLRFMGPAHRLSSAALLPARLREEYGLGWSRTHSVALALAAGPLRLVATPLFLAAARTSPSTAAYMDAASVTAEG